MCDDFGNELDIPLNAHWQALRFLLDGMTDVPNVVLIAYCVGG